MGVMMLPRNDADTDTVALLTKVSAQLDKVSSEVKSTAEDALKQANKSGVVSAETKATADKLLTSQSAMNKVVEALKAQVEGLDSKTQDIAQQFAEGGAGGGQNGPVLSLGQAFAGETDKIKAFVSNGFTGVMSVTVQNAITTAAGSGGGLISRHEETTPIGIQRRRLLIRGLLTQGKTGSNGVHVRKQVLRDNQAAATAEGGTSQASAYGWDKELTPVKKITHVTNISEETMSDADELQTEIDSEMRYGLDLEEENQLLAGDGLGENHSGLLTEAPSFVAAAGLPNATRIDRLRLGILQIALEDHIASSFVLNPLDWAAIDLLKDTTGRYIFGNAFGQSSPSLWGKDVVETSGMGAGEWLTGDLALAATIYDRQETEVLISSEHGTNFVEGMLTMKAQKRLALAIKRALAMCKGDFVFV
ncbi:phage major capsid protein [Falsihalocynthiibacter sp. BN13B15]|uniref:phage major capsid protein n=1 Tax=Falsihalocynthiibacter sp. BN13B15 TaxID=3240871 RepID=UPI0035104CE8